MDSTAVALTWKTWVMTLMSKYDGISIASREEKSCTLSDTATHEFILNVTQLETRFRPSYKHHFVFISADGPVPNVNVRFCVTSSCIHERVVLTTDPLLFVALSPLVAQNVCA